MSEGEKKCPILHVIVLLKWPENRSERTLGKRMQNFDEGGWKENSCMIWKIEFHAGSFADISSVPWVIVKKKRVHDLVHAVLWSRPAVIVTKAKQCTAWPVHRFWQEIKKICRHSYTCTLMHRHLSSNANSTLVRIDIFKTCTKKDARHDFDIEVGRS